MKQSGSSYDNEMEILTTTGITRNRIGGTRTKKEINRQSKKTNISNE